MTSQTNQKYALVTGCSAGGIGAALALEFASRGVHVFATARTPAKMPRALGELPNVTLLPMDVTSQPSVDAAAAAVSKRTDGRLDFLVSNAGSLVVSPVLDLDVDLARRMFDVNVWGVVAVTQAFAPLVVEARGCVANLASVAALLSPPYMVAYASSKAACEALSDGLRRELAPFGVRVATVITGAVETNLHSNTRQVALPEGSLYASVADKISDRATGKDAQGRTCSTEVFAKRLVGDLMGGASGKLYRGNMATLMDLVTRYLPAWLVDRLVIIGSGLSTIHEN